IAGEYGRQGVGGDIAKLPLVSLDGRQTAVGTVGRSAASPRSRWVARNLVRTHPGLRAAAAANQGRIVGFGVRRAELRLERLPAPPLARVVEALGRQLSVRRLHDAGVGIAVAGVERTLLEDVHRPALAVRFRLHPEIDPTVGQPFVYQQSR